MENAAAKAAAADEAARKLASSTQNGGKEPAPEKKNFSGLVKGRQCDFPLGGRTTRVDFQIQPGMFKGSTSVHLSLLSESELCCFCHFWPGVIDNEYLSAVTAHSSYFCNEDLIDFLIFNTRPDEENKSVN